jgi:hypothetical protein
MVANHNQFVVVDRNILPAFHANPVEGIKAGLKEKPQSLLDQGPEKASFFKEIGVGGGHKPVTLAFLPEFDRPL